MEATMMLAALPLLLLNLLGGVIGGIGLAIRGEWALLFGGLAWAIAGPFVLSVAMLPGMIFAPLAAWAANRGRTGAAVAVAAALPSLAWTYVVLGVSCVIAFHAVVARPDAGLIHLLWGYTAATAPWSFLARKDREAGNEASTMLMFFAQIGTVAMMIASWSEPAAVEIGSLAVWFTPFLVLGLAAQLFTAWAEGRHARYRY